MDPDSSRLRVTVTDGRGRHTRDEGLGRWLASVAPGRVRGEVAVALAGDTQVRALNRRYRRRDSATDVLAFEISGGGEGKVRFTQRSRGLTPARSRSATPRLARAAGAFLGDIVIATGVARRQARERGHAYRTELRILALHGLLHLLGYDHERAEDGGRMARAEARLRRKGGLKEGLIGRRPRGRS